MPETQWRPRQACSTRSHLDILAMALLLHSSTSRHARAALELTIAAELLPFGRPMLPACSPASHISNLDGMSR